LELSKIKFAETCGVQNGKFLEISKSQDGTAKWTNLFFLSVLLADIRGRTNKKIQCSQQQLQRRYPNRVEMHDKKIALK